MQYLPPKNNGLSIDFLIGGKQSQNGGQVKVSFRELKAQIYWPNTDQKVWGSNPCGRTTRFQLKPLRIKC